MPRIKAVTLTLLSLGKTAQAALPAQIFKALPSACKKLMGVGLMAHVPDQLVLRKIQKQMKSHGKLHRSQIRTQMPAAAGDFFDQEIPDLLCKLLIVRGIYILNIIGAFNHIK